MHIAQSKSNWVKNFGALFEYLHIDHMTHLNLLTDNCSYCVYLLETRSIISASTYLYLPTCTYLPTYTYLPTPTYTYLPTPT